MITNVEDAIRRVIAVNWKGEAIPPVEHAGNSCAADAGGLSFDRIMMDYEKERVVTLGDLTPEWWL